MTDSSWWWCFYCGRWKDVSYELHTAHECIEYKKFYDMENLENLLKVDIAVDDAWERNR